ncbi:MAG: carboxypeptidase-like regulatory domain-containing protein [Burkholderiales bacterium]|nr:carboxypeptidase-like regulatory domain-containing protein [Bacteroidia bacterium]
MKASKLYFVIILIGFLNSIKGQHFVTIYGNVRDYSNNKSLQYAAVQIQNSNYGTSTSERGLFSITVPAKKHFSVVFKLLGYTTLVKETDLNESHDSIFISVTLLPSPTLVDTIAIYSSLKPDTLVGSPNYSIYDFDFYEDKYILLTAIKTLEKSELKLADASGKIITTYKVPKEGGEAKEFYQDYMGYTNLICKNYIYRINMYHDRFVLIPLSIEDVNSFIKPILDTINGKLIFSDFWKDYPLFNYYSFNEKDSAKLCLHTVLDKDLMHAYNFEYYSLMPKEKLAARRLAMEMKTDKHIVASLMSGFTKSMFYEPLFAPLYIIKDTICIFDHYKDKLYHLNKSGIKIDSISINYNHPKNWKEWKNKMLKDDIENLIYAVYDKNGHKYIKHISSQNGKEQGKYTLQFHSADKLKIHDGYAYYIYRPFESTQEKFFYRELITIKKN